MLHCFLLPMFLSPVPQLQNLFLYLLHAQLPLTRPCRQPLHTRVGQIHSCVVLDHLRFGILAQQNQFDNYLLDAISAVVVGGTSLFGGQGGIGNTIVGLLVLGVLNNGLDHVRMDSFLKILIRGLVLLLALVVNVYAQRLRAKYRSAGG